MCFIDCILPAAGPDFGSEKVSHKVLVELIYQLHFSNSAAVDLTLSLYKLAVYPITAEVSYHKLFTDVFGD